MAERSRLGLLERRLALAFLTVALVALAVLFAGVITAHRPGAPPPDMLDGRWLLASLLVAVPAAVLLSGMLARRLVGPINRCIETATAFAAGDRSARPPAGVPAELKDLTAALAAAADEVERSEQARRLLTADIAHELRTPLAALQGGLEELRDGYRAPDRAALAALHAQAVRMGRILDDLSALSAAESSKLHLRQDPVDLGRVVAQALESWRGQLRAAGLRLEFVAEDRVWVVADAGRVHQMIGNLLANAAHYCRRGDSVRVTVGRSAGAGRVEVVDSGPGLPPGELLHLFDRGWRSRSSVGNAGSGLGLPIVRALALAQGGTAGAERHIGGGLALTIALPLVDQEGCSGDPHPPAARHADAP